MNYYFDIVTGLIIVNVQFHGPKGVSNARLVLDTGSNGTVVNKGFLLNCGYDLNGESDDSRRLATISGIETAGVVQVESMTVFDKKLWNYPVLAHSLPPESGIDGLLGLDYFHDKKLTIEFPAQEVSVTDY